MDTKKCSKCGEIKEVLCFYKRSKGNTFHSACKTCEKAMAKDWYSRNKTRAIEKYKEWRVQNSDSIKEYRSKNRRKHYQQELMRKYGVDADWFESQMNIQNRKCECCGKTFEWGNKHTTPHVDHCHSTNRVRGILCNRCNSVIGLCEDNPAILTNIVRYLKECHGTSATPS